MPRQPMRIALENNLTNATRHPDTYYFSAAAPYNWFIKSGAQNNNLWSDGNIAVTTPVPKSVFDPCPAGWRVAPFLSGTSPFATMTKDNSTWGNYGRTGSGTGEYFPASGFQKYTSGGAFSTMGTCWSGSPNDQSSYYFDFDRVAVNPIDSSTRTYGFPVRCSQE